MNVFTCDEVENEVAIGPLVPPRFVRLDVTAPIRCAIRGLAVADIDDAAVVEVYAFGPIAFDDVVMPVGTREREVLPGVEVAAVMLPQPLAVAPQIVPVPGRPEFLEKLGTLVAPGPIEPIEVLVRRDEGQVFAILAHRWRIIIGCAMQVVAETVRRAEQTLGPGPFEQPEPGLAADTEIGIEGGECRVETAGLPLHSATLQQDLGHGPRGCRRRMPECREGDVQLDIDPLLERGPGQLDQAK